MGSFKRFVEAGLRVVVLEQGDWPDDSKARANHPDFELTMGRYWSGNPNRRQATADYPIDDSGSWEAPCSIRNCSQPMNLKQVREKADGHR